MTKKDSLRRSLAELAALRSNPGSPGSVEALRKALAQKNNHVAAAAAHIAGESGPASLEAELLAAFDRFMADPLKSDPGCSAKTEIMEALYRLGCEREAPFLAGIRHVQLEPVFGGKEDTAAQLRAWSALGLARMGHPEAMNLLAELLADPQLDARLGAIRAIAAAGQASGLPLLRFKARNGDPDPRVIDACLRALLQMEPGPSLPFVASFLKDENETVCEAAALALGESRLEGAFEPLRAWCGRVLDSPLRYPALTAVALLRSDQAFAYLLSLVEQGPPGAAKDAVAILRLYQDDRELWRRVEKAVAKRAPDS